MEIDESQDVGKEKYTKVFWTQIQMKGERDRHSRPSRTAHRPQPSDSDLEPYYDQAYANTAMQKLSGIAPGLEQRQLDLEKLLDQLYEDLSHSEIDPIIVSGHCKKCP